MKLLHIFPPGNRDLKNNLSDLNGDICDLDEDPSDFNGDRCDLIADIIDLLTTDTTMIRLERPSFMNTVSFLTHNHKIISSPTGTLSTKCFSWTSSAKTSPGSRLMLTFVSRFLVKIYNIYLK